MDPSQRLRLILQRQSGFVWGEKYEPAIKATPQEGPKISRVSQINSLKLGRCLHLLSEAERFYAQLALYNPALIDLHEQKMLSPVPTIHPLYGHPLNSCRDLPSIKGTVDVADRIGFRHYAITTTGNSGEYIRIPYPYVGDLLLYLEGYSGQPYCVNWTVKRSSSDFFERRSFKLKSFSQQRKDRELGEQRTRLEEIYYLDAGIRTVQVSMDGMNKNFVANMNELFSYQARRIYLEKNILDRYLKDVRRAILYGDPVHRVINLYGAKYNVRDQFITAFFQGIWSRCVSVNLFDPIFTDHPLEQQRQDPLEIFSDLFCGTHQ